MLTFLLFQTVTPTFDWSPWIGQGIAVTMFVLMLGFLIKALPTWERIKFRELEVRDKEAVAAGQTSTTLEAFGKIVENLAIEQRKATEITRIQQRVINNESLQLTNAVDGLVERMDSLEDTLKEQGYDFNKPKAVKTVRS
jgi:hypothetical protein